MADASDVAGWMLAEFQSEGMLYQAHAASSIQDLFGDEFVYDNENGNLAMDRRVLREFRKLTEGKVVWSRSEFCWYPNDGTQAGRTAD